MSKVYLSLLALATSFVLAHRLIPLIIRTANQKQLYDVPKGRKQHQHPTPALGGVAIFLSFIFSACIWYNIEQAELTRYLFLSVFVLFFSGLQDDLLELNALKKLFIQLAAAAWVCWGGIRFNSFYGLLGIEALPLFWQYALSMLFITAVTNAFNLIDGIDGLAGGLALISVVIMGVLFGVMGNTVYALLCAALAGALLAFLVYNFHPARIFLGDAGSLTTGFLLATFSLKLVSMNAAMATPLMEPVLMLTVVASLVFIPAIDLIQVSLRRILRGESPFKADRGHLHHLLLGVGLNHLQAAVFFHTVAIWMIAFTLILVMNGWHAVHILLIQLLAGVLLLAYLYHGSLAWQARFHTVNKASLRYLLHEKLTKISMAINQYLF